MSATQTLQIPLGFIAPPFHLPDTISGETYSFNDLKGEKGTVVMFICNHCPYVIHVMNELVKIGNEYRSKGIGFIAISSNDVEKYPQDSPELMKVFAKENKFPFPYLYDESQDIAKAYFAACTPDFSMFNAQDMCVYRGQLDSSRPKNDNPITGKDLREALLKLLNGQEIDTLQIPSIGCNIKWKPEVSTIEFEQ